MYSYLNSIDNVIIKELDKLTLYSCVCCVNWCVRVTSELHHAGAFCLTSLVWKTSDFVVGHKKQKISSHPTNLSLLTTNIPDLRFSAH